MGKAEKQNAKEKRKSSQHGKKKGERGAAQQAVVPLYACRGRCRSTYVCGDVCP